MNKILRLTFVAAFAVVSSFSFAQKTVTFSAAETQDPNNASVSKDGVTVAISSGKMDNKYAYRIYKNATCTVSSDVEITKIEMVCDDYSDGKYLADGFEALEGLTISGDKVNATWEGTSKSVVFTATNHQVRAKSITVTLKEETTGINDVVVKANENAPLYNLAGQRVGANYKGVVIQNGKKFIQK